MARGAFAGRAAVALSLALIVAGCKSQAAPGGEAFGGAGAPNGTKKVKVVFVGGEPAVADSRTPPAKPPPAPAPAPALAPEARGTLTWDAPAQWQRTTPSSAMRLAQYSVPRAAGDAQDGELAVFFFGPQGAGSVDETFGRWLAPFDEKAREKASRSSRKVGTFEVATLEAQGSYEASKSAMGAGSPGGDAGALQAAGLLGAVVRAHDGVYYFKLIGPPKTVDGARKAFSKMIESCRAASPG
jgi:hypothetical protein